ncbi:N-acetylmuramoyl-L-alanine amidase, partial [Bacteroides sp.]
MTRKIDLIVIHCSATREDRTFTEHDLEVCHRRRGFNGTGYHFYIRKDGRIVTTRPLERVGAHAKGYNAHSIGICYEGGLDAHGKPKDTRTEWQKHSLQVLVKTLL